MKSKFLDGLDLKGKIVFLRCDLNVPLDKSISPMEKVNGLDSSCPFLTTSTPRQLTMHSSFLHVQQRLAQSIVAPLEAGELTSVRVTRSMNHRGCPALWRPVRSTL